MLSDGRAGQIEAAPRAAKLVGANTAVALQVEGLPNARRHASRPGMACRDPEISTDTDDDESFPALGHPVIHRVYDPGLHAVASLSSRLRGSPRR